jgi:hypothetical protein
MSCYTTMTFTINKKGWISGKIDEIDQLSKNSNKSLYLLLFRSFKIFMSMLSVFYRSVLLFLLLLVSIQGVSGWDVQDLIIKPGEGPISPQTPVTVTYTVHFASFPSQNTLDMYTDLTNAHWVVTKSEIIEDQPPITSLLVEKNGSRVRIDGWTLSYVRRIIELNVQLKGVAPNVDRSQDQTIIRVQELTPNAQPILDSGISKKYQIYVPTLTQITTTPTLTQTLTEIVRTENTLATSATPTRKQTYSPSPEPLMICGMLTGLAIIVAMKRER